LSSTEVVWQIFRIRVAVHWRKILEQLIHPESYTYEMAMALDKDLRKDYGELLSLRIHGNLNERDGIEFVLVNR
jgi:hypothetical protein